MAKIDNMPGGEVAVAAGADLLMLHVSGISSSISVTNILKNAQLTGIPAAITAAPGTNTTQLATTAFVLANTTGGDMFLADNLAGLANVSAARANIGLNNVQNVDTTNASNITAGTLPLSVLPTTVFERTYVYTGVQTSPELMGLTLVDVQNGDLISIQNIANAGHKKSWAVVNDASLAVSSSFVEIGGGIAGDTVLFNGSNPAYYLSRANHTGTQAQSTITNLVSDLAAKAPINSPTFTGTVSGVTQAMVGLTNVDDTSDINKPLSTASSNALALKANLASPVLTGTPTAPTATVGNNTAQIATTAFVLANIPPGSAGIVDDGDYVSVVVSGTGTVWTLKDNIVTNTKMAQIASKTYKGRTSAGVGVLEDVPVGAIKTDLALTKVDVGLSDVDDVSDVNKPVSIAQQAALDLKANIASPTFTGTVSGITKAMVGLTDVDDTSDLAKPISTLTQSALDLKANIASPTFTGTVSGITKAMVGLANVDNTSDLSKPISTLTQSALDLKADLASPTFTGTVSGITKAMVGLANVDDTSDATKFTNTPLTGIPTAPTAPAGTSTTQLATTAFAANVLGDYFSSYAKTWQKVAAVSALTYSSICYSNELGMFAAIAEEGGNTGSVVRSYDGVTWTIASAPSTVVTWTSVTWAPEIGKFCAVGKTGGANTRAMTSSNGQTWQFSVTIPSRSWESVCWSAGLSLFVAVASDGTTDAVMTSPTGVTWTTRTSVPSGKSWSSVCWSPQLKRLVAVNSDGASAGAVMSSLDGITWAAANGTVNNACKGVVWAASLGLFVATLQGTTSGIMTSPDGLTWAARTTTSNNWANIAWSASLGVLVAVNNGKALAGDPDIMLSRNGIDWESLVTSNEAQSFTGICWGERAGIFVAVGSNTGATNQIRISLESRNAQ